MTLLNLTGNWLLLTLLHGQVPLLSKTLVKQVCVVTLAVLPKLKVVGPGTLLIKCCKGSRMVEKTTRHPCEGGNPPLAQDCRLCGIKDGTSSIAASLKAEFVSVGLTTVFG